MLSRNALLGMTPNAVDLMRGRFGPDSVSDADYAWFKHIWRNSAPRFSEVWESEQHKTRGEKSACAHCKDYARLKRNAAARERHSIMTGHGMRRNRNGTYE